MELPVSSQYRLAKHVCEIPWKWTVQPNPRWLQPSWTAWAGLTRLSPNSEVLTRHSTWGVNIHCHFEEARFGVICYSTTNTFSSATVTMKSECTWESILQSIGHHSSTAWELSSVAVTLHCREVFVSLDFGWRLRRMCTPKSCLGRCTNGRQSETMKAWEHHSNREEARQNSDSPFRQPSSRGYGAWGNIKSELCTNRHAR